MKKAASLLLGLALTTSLVINFTSATKKSVASETTTQTVVVSTTKTQVEIVSLEHEVKAGETLSTISENTFASSEYFQVIYDQNSLALEKTAKEHGFASSENGHWIFPGQKLTISFPVFKQVTQISKIPAPKASETEKATVTNTVTASPTVTLSPSRTAVPTATETPTVKSISKTATVSSTLTSTVTSTSTPSATVTPSFIFSPVSPLDGVSGVSFYISTYFGEYAQEDPNHPHKGIDIANRQRLNGFPIKAIEQGKVIFSGWDSGYGFSVIIAHPDGHFSRYGHFKTSPIVGINSKVEKGQVLGYMGSTGYSTGPHLHLEIWNSKGQLEDPLKYLNEKDFNFVPVPTPVLVTPTPQTVAEQKETTSVSPFVSLYSKLIFKRNVIVWQLSVEKLNRDKWLWASAVARNTIKQQNALAELYFFFRPFVPVVYKNYTVKAGDTLSEIAGSAEVSEQDLIVLNSLQEPSLLKVGQVVMLPPNAMQVNIVHEPSSTKQAGYSLDKMGYTSYLKEMALRYGASFDSLMMTMGCENYTFNPNVDYIDSDGTETAGIAQFKEGTYKSAASRMGLSQAEINDWKNPYNQLSAMAWKFANGEAGAWTGYVNMVKLGRCRI